MRKVRDFQVMPARGLVKQRFTLIELLVVIAIIAILAAILMPALSSARGRAQAATCQTNMKELGQAVIRYADDHNGIVIPRRTSTATGYVTYWPAIMTANKYINWRSLTCPVSYEWIISPASTVPNENYRKAWRKGLFVTDKAYAATTQACAYGMNYRFNFDNHKNSYSRLITTGMVKRPSMWLIFGEGRSTPNKADGYPMFYVRSNYNGTETGYLYPWHNETMCNILFFDGHVKGYSTPPGWEGTQYLYDGPIGSQLYEGFKTKQTVWHHGYSPAGQSGKD